MTGDALRAASGFVCIGFDGHELPAESAALLKGGVRSVIHFTRNFGGVAQMSRLNRDIVAAAEGPVLVTVDHEGGRVQRFRGEGFPDLPSGRAMGEAGPEAAHAAGMAAAQHLRAVGFTMNLAPVLDVDSNPANPVIGARAAASTSPATATRMWTVTSIFQGWRTAWSAWRPSSSCPSAQRCARASRRS
jgi:beta-N-acetylhexosaminidase